MGVTNEELSDMLDEQLASLDDGDVISLPPHKSQGETVPQTADTVSADYRKEATQPSSIPFVPVPPATPSDAQPAVPSPPAQPSHPSSPSAPSPASRDGGEVAIRDDADDAGGNDAGNDRTDDLGSLREIPESFFANLRRHAPISQDPKATRHPGFSESIVRAALASVADGKGAFVLRNGTRYEFMAQDEVTVDACFVVIQRVVRYQGNQVTGGGTAMFPLTEISSLELT